MRNVENVQNMGNVEREWWHVRNMRNADGEKMVKGWPKLYS